MKLNELNTIYILQALKILSSKQDELGNAANQLLLKSRELLDDYFEKQDKCDEIEKLNLQISNIEKIWRYSIEISNYLIKFARIITSSEIDYTINLAMFLLQDLNEINKISELLEIDGKRLINAVKIINTLYPEFKNLVDEYINQYNQIVTAVEEPSQESSPINR